jgi:hypothetical protein
LDCGASTYKLSVEDGIRSWLFSFLPKRIRAKKVGNRSGFIGWIIWIQRGFVERLEYS